MSGIPPQVSADPGTPAHEWAQSTTTAAFARPDPAPGFAGADGAPTADLASKHAGTERSPFAPPPLFAGQQSQSWSTASTPGGDIPGAFPADKDQRDAPPLDTQAVAETARSAAQTVSETASSAAQTIAQTAAQYAPAVQEYVAPVQRTVVDSIAQYIPGKSTLTNATGTTTPGSSGVAAGAAVQASEHDQPHARSMPSMELSGAHSREHVDGAGALPGGVSEEGVARAPDELNARSLPQRGNAPPPPPTTTKTTAVAPRTSMPSMEVTGQQPFEHSAGAGALPGTVREAGVAEPPDGEARGTWRAGAARATDSGTARARVYDVPGERPAGEWERGEGNETSTGRRAAAGVGALVGGREEGVGVLPEERAQQQQRAFTGEVRQGPQDVRGVAEGADEIQGDAPPAQAQQPEEHKQEKDEKKEEKKEEGGAKAQVSGHKGQPNKAAGYDTDYHPSQLHPPRPKEDVEREAQEKAGEDARKEKDQAGADDAAKDGDKDGEKDGEKGEKHKKAGFMEKMKGEAKSLLGKVEGKGHKKNDA